MPRYAIKHNRQKTPFRVYDVYGFGDSLNEFDLLYMLSGNLKSGHPNHSKGVSSGYYRAAAQNKHKVCCYLIFLPLWTLLFKMHAVIIVVSAKSRGSEVEMHAIQRAYNAISDYGINHHSLFSAYLVLYVLNILY